MQKVIKNIINKLEERAEEHDFEGNRFAERKYWEDYCAEKNKMKGLNEAIEIVKQEAEKYNNGWIPCSERLPENVDHLADGDKKKQYLVMTRNGRYEVAEWLEVYDKPFWCGHYSQEIKDVIRWKPLEPYQPKGE